MANGYGFLYRRRDVPSQISSLYLGYIEAWRKDDMKHGRDYEVEHQCFSTMTRHTPRRASMLGLSSLP